MYLTLPQTVLRQALAQVAHLAGGKTSLPILKHVLFEASWGALCLRASNEETSIGVHVQASVQASGSVLLPAKVLAELVPDLPSAPLTLAVPAPTDPAKALLQCGRARVLLNLSSLAADEFPSLPQRSDEGAEELVLLDGELLKELITQVAFAAADDLTHPALAGVQLLIAEGRASFVAADTFRLATRTIAVPDPRLTRRLLIPAGALLELVRLLPSSGAVQLLMVGNHLLVHTEHLDLATRLMHETYPDFRSVTTTTSETQAVLSLADLTSALRLMAPFARADGYKLHLSVSTEETAGLRLRAVAPDLGENDLQLAATVTGPEQSLLLNWKGFSELLAAFPGQQVSLELAGPRRPIALHPVAAIDAVSVIMPMHENPTVAAPTPPVATAATPA